MDNIESLEYIPDRDDLAVASYRALKHVVDHHQFLALVWSSDNSDYDPLLIDAFTADAMVKVYDALSPDNKVKFERVVAKGRGPFYRLVDFTWKQF